MLLLHKIHNFCILFIEQMRPLLFLFERDGFDTIVCGYCIALINLPFIFVIIVFSDVDFHFHVDDLSSLLRLLLFVNNKIEIIYIQMPKKNKNKDQPNKHFAKPTPFPSFTEKVEEALKVYSCNLESSKKQGEPKAYYIVDHEAYYEGPWSEGKPNGWGRCMYKDGSFYIGNFVLGVAQDSRGKLFLSNGAFFEGDIKNNKIDGSGIMKHTTDNGEYIYKGDWQNSKPHGDGTETYTKDGVQYKGQFAFGVKQGQGQYTDRANNEVYEGQFKRGLFHGQGKIMVNGYLSYEGQFENGKKKGKGTMVTETGKLTGEFINDEINGEGRFQWKKGDKVYEGDFKKSKFHGDGRITYQNSNQVVRGSWREGHNTVMNVVETD